MKTFLESLGQFTPDQIILIYGLSLTAYATSDVAEHKGDNIHIIASYYPDLHILELGVKVDNGDNETFLSVDFEEFTDREGDGYISKVIMTEEPKEEPEEKPIVEGIGFIIFR